MSYKLNQQKELSNLQFHTKSFWENFYKKRNKGNRNINWYFDITKTKIPEFPLDNFSIEDDEILLIGPGLSSILDYLDSKGFFRVTIFDFSEEANNIIRERYNKEWEILNLDITGLTYSFKDEFDIIIDKGCLDCILSDTKNGENKFIRALNNLLVSLDPDDGVLYYFSDGKLEDRINLFYKIPKIKYKVSTIDMNEIMKNEYKEFNRDDNLYYLYTITKMQ